MLAEISILRERRRRSNCEPEQLRALLIATGANILEFRAVSRIIPMPFAGLRPLPALYEIRAKHDQRCGCWYVRTASGSAGPDWLWHDADGYEGSPLPQLGDAVQGDPVSISWTRDWIVVGGAIVIGASITLWLVM